MHTIRKSIIAARPTLVLGYAVAVVMSTVGILILAGMFVHPGVPQQLRIMFGVVMMLMGLYRFVLTWTRQLQLSKGGNNDEDEPDPL